MGDLLGSPRVAPLLIFFSFRVSFFFPSRVVRLSYSFLHGSPGPPTWAHARSHVLVRGLGGSMGGVGSGQKGTVFRSETGLRARLVAPRRPDALSGEIPSFWPPNGRRFFFFPQFGYLLWHLVSHSFLGRGRIPLNEFFAHCQSGAIIPALMHRIPSELRS